MTISKKKRRSRSSKSTDETEKVEKAEELPEPEPERDPAPVVPPKADVIPITKKAARAITVDRFVRGLGSFGEAYAAVEKMEHPTTRKLPREEWQQDFEAWMKRPRG